MRTVFDWRWIFAIVVGVLILGVFLQPASSQTTPEIALGPGETGPCSVSGQQSVTVDSWPTYVYYPVGCPADWAAPPFAGIVFAHGFSLSIGGGIALDGRANNLNTAIHLASWGFVVALPRFTDSDTPTNFDQRVAGVQRLFTYFETETQNPASVLYQKVDLGRLGVAGHSLGGSTALAVSGRDPRVGAVVALDPVYHKGGMGQTPDPVWNPALDGPTMHAPTAIFGSPANDCNDDADYADLYPLAAATHRAEYLIPAAGHCDFNDPASSFCPLFCGASGLHPEATALSRKYLTAWLLYYLQAKDEQYAVLFGASAEQDIAAGVIVSQVDTAPHGLALYPMAGGSRLQWIAPPPGMIPGIIAGYHIYRRTSTSVWERVAELGVASAWEDFALQAGQIYLYRICSHDRAGNEHQYSAEAVFTMPYSHAQFLPLISNGAP